MRDDTKRAPVWNYVVLSLFLLYVGIGGLIMTSDAASTETLMWVVAGTVVVTSFAVLFGLQFRSNRKDPSHSISKRQVRVMVAIIGVLAAVISREIATSGDFVVLLAGTCMSMIVFPAGVAMMVNRWVGRSRK